ncbi:MAG: hypothetical protein ACREPQ_14540 [Rhodanobacter sp.]
MPHIFQSLTMCVTCLTIVGALAYILTRLVVGYRLREAISRDIDGSYRSAPHQMAASVSVHFVLGIAGIMALGLILPDWSQLQSLHGRAIFLLVLWAILLPVWLSVTDRLSKRFTGYLGSDVLTEAPRDLLSRQNSKFEGR